MAGFDWIDFGASASARVFAHVVAIVPSFDESGRNVAEHLARSFDDVSKYSGEDVLVFVPVRAPAGMSISELAWASKVAGSGQTHVERHARRSRALDALSLIAALRDDLASRGLPQVEQTFVLYLDFVPSDTPDEFEVLGEAIALGTAPTGAMLLELARLWGEAARKLKSQPHRQGALAREVHGGVLPSAFAWRVVLKDVSATVGRLKGFLEVVSAIASLKIPK